MSELILTPSQERGYDKFQTFYLDPSQTVMLLKGYSGTGKTTLVKRFLQDIPQMDAMAKLIAPEYRPKKIILAATTNQAAEAFALAVEYKYEVRTIHSVCELRLQTNYKTGEKSLMPHGPGVEDAFIFCDEASFVDQKLLALIFQQTKRCKIVFMGDPAQLTPVEDDHMPVFLMNACEVELTDLVRFEGGIMQNLMGNLRAAVMEGNWSKFPLVPGVIERVDRQAFMGAADTLFRDPDAGQVKILAYTNDRVVKYNNFLSRNILGTSEPQAGQKMLVNEAVNNSASRCTNNEEVTIESIEPATSHGVDGYEIVFRGKGGYYFMPKARGKKMEAHRRASMEDDWEAMKEILDTWIDLRPAFAQTVNKSQGSTYDIGLIDLDDICGHARTLEQLARLLYVALSRFRKRIILTGDLRRK